jgi:ribosome-associated toxin RatA of RatAB toxin-antitoxin module
MDSAPVTARPSASVGPRAPFDLGDLPSAATMTTVDETIVRAPLDRIFAIAADVERWPQRLAHYRYVTLRDRRRDGGGLVEMSANRPFGALQWPTWWESEMAVLPPRGGADDRPAIRFRHVRGITTGMEVEWQFVALGEAASTRVRIVHLWNGPPWPLIGTVAARAVIGPVFVHGIASRTLAGLARAAEENG